MNLRKIVAAIAIAVPLLATSVASADRKLSREDKEDCARIRGGDTSKPCVMDFSKGDDIDGDKKIPTGSDIETIMSAMFGNLIKYRLDFRPEMIRTAERL
jgi:hypothetical protein